MSFQVIGIGEAVWDLLPSGPQLGGAPANFAYHAHALGAHAWSPASAMTVLAGKFGGVSRSWGLPMARCRWMTPCRPAPSPSRPVWQSPSQLKIRPKLADTQKL